jgi:phage antirepressor YoqD-like protein
MEHKCRCQSNIYLDRHNLLSVEFAVKHRPTHMCKRLHAKETPQEVHKKQKVSHPTRSEPPAAFWDKLSRIWLTIYALRELDRRNNRGVLHKQISNPVTHTVLAKWKEENWQAIQPTVEFLDRCTSQRLRDIREFARLCDLDLSDLRGASLPLF